MKTSTASVALAYAAIQLLAIAPSFAQQADEEIAFTVNGEDVPVSYFERFKGAAQVTDEQAKDQFVTMMATAQAAAKNGMLDDPRVKLVLRWQELQLLSRFYAEEFLRNTDVEETEVRSEYDKFVESQAGTKQYLASHILVEDEDLANSLLSDIDGNLDTFAEAARDHSIDTGSGKEGGSLGWASPQVYVKEFADALAGLSAGEISEVPIKSEFGWHIILLADVRDSVIPEFEDIQEQIAQQMLRVRLATHLDELRSSAELKDG